MCCLCGNRCFVTAFRLCRTVFILTGHHACSRSAFGLSILWFALKRLYTQDAACAAYRQCRHSSQAIALMLQGEVMNVEAAPAAVGAVAPMVVPSEPVSIVVDEKLMVVLNKDGGVESMEVNGGMALQVTQLLSMQCHFYRTTICQQQLSACTSLMYAMT